MNIFIGLTDYNWYSILRNKNIDEVNFWRPGSTAFHALQPNDLFLFKLKKPYYSIVGGGFFISYSSVPIDLAWKAFGEKNGTKDYQDFGIESPPTERRTGSTPHSPILAASFLPSPSFSLNPNGLPRPTTGRSVQ